MMILELITALLCFRPIILSLLRIAITTACITVISEPEDLLHALRQVEQFASVISHSNRLVPPSYRWENIPGNHEASKAADWISMEVDRNHDDLQCIANANHDAKQLHSDIKGHPSRCMNWRQTLHSSFNSKPSSYRNCRETKLLPMQWIKSFCYALCSKLRVGQRLRHAFYAQK